MEDMDKLEENCVSPSCFSAIHKDVYGWSPVSCISTDSAIKIEDIFSDDLSSASENSSLGILYSSCINEEKALEEALQEQEEKQKHNSLKASEEFKKKREKAISYLKETVQRTMEYSKFIREKMCHPQEKASKQPVLLSGVTLLPHQLEGFEWLKLLSENGLNGILADEMGLGKTVQSIAIIAHLILQGIGGPFLVCAPLTTIRNWYSEFQNFAPQIPVKFYHGNKEQRREVRLLFNEKMKIQQNVTSAPVFITTYNVLLTDYKHLSKVTWKYFVFDEGHRLKNFQCKLFRVMKQFNILNLLLLTGTPLQNNMSELWSLLNLALPQVFNDLSGFESLLDASSLCKEDANYILVSQEKEDNFIQSIHQILTPFMLRRTKNDVNLDLPPKKEVIVYAPLTSVQANYYQAILNKTIYKLLGQQKEVESCCEFGRSKRQKKTINYCEPDNDSGFEEHAPENTDATPEISKKCDDLPRNKVHLKMTNVKMMLREVCMHPYLICHQINPQTEELIVSEELVKSSGKLLILDAMLPELRKRGHKVLIFSQMKMMLDLLAVYCKFRKFPFFQIDGTVPLVEREKQINQFNKNKKSFIFLLSTRAGGLGINLTNADTVIIYDSDWNPQCDLQAQSRCHRIGQKKTVVVYRLVTKNTIDEKMVECAAAKRKLEKLVIQDGCFSTNDTLSKHQKHISEEELLALLNSSDVKRYVDSEDVISKANLDLLLDRSDWNSQDDCSKNVSGVFKTMPN